MVHLLLRFELIGGLALIAYVAISLLWPSSDAVPEWVDLLVGILETIVLFWIVYVFFLRPFVRPLVLRGLVKSYQFPAGLAQSPRARHPHLSETDLGRVIEALRMLLMMYVTKDGLAPVWPLACPSRVVGDALVAFAAEQREYRAFCDEVFDRRLEPEQFIADSRLVHARLRRTWVKSCELEGLDPDRPSRLPELFAIDAELRIADGAHYALPTGRPAFDALMPPPRPTRAPAELIEEIWRCVGRYMDEPQRRAQIDALAEEIRDAIGRHPFPNREAWAPERIEELFKAIERVPDLWQAVFGDCAVAGLLRERLCALPPRRDPG